MNELTVEEIDKAVHDWEEVDWSVRSVQLGRGHWEEIAPVIAKAAQAKLQSYYRDMTPEKLRGEVRDIVIGVYNQGFESSKGIPTQNVSFDKRTDQILSLVMAYKVIKEVQDGP